MSLKTRKRIKVQWTFYRELKIKERIEVRWSETVWGGMNHEPENQREVR